MQLARTLFSTVTALSFALSVPQTILADGGSSGDHKLFVRSVIENPDGTATFPLHRGTSKGHYVYFVMTDASDGNFAQQFGLNTSQKLANVAGTTAVQRVTVLNGIIDFPATVDFRPDRQVMPGPTGFPPANAAPGAIGELG